MWVSKNVYSAPFGIKYPSPTFLYWPKATVMSDNYGIAVHDEGNGNLVFLESSDGGSNWTGHTADSSGTTGEYCELIWIEPQTWGIAYFDESAGRIQFAKTTDNGSNWTITEVVNPSLTPDDGLVRPLSIAAVDVDTYVVAYLNDGVNDLYFTKTTDGGATWSSGSVLNLELPRSIDVAIVDAETWCVAYYSTGAGGAGNDDLRFAKTTNSGANWTTTTIDSTGNAVGDGVALAVVDADTYIAVYHDRTNEDVRFAKTTNGGTSWSTSILDTGPISANADQHGIAVVDTDTYIVSYPDNGADDVYFAITTNGGTSWTTTLIENNNWAINGGIDTSIAVADSDTYVLIYPHTDGNNIRFAKTTNSGSSFTVTTIFTSSGSIENLSIAVAAPRRPRPVDFSTV